MLSCGLLADELPALTRGGGHVHEFVVTDPAEAEAFLDVTPFAP